MHWYRSWQRYRSWWPQRPARDLQAGNRSRTAAQKLCRCDITISTLDACVSTGSTSVSVIVPLSVPEMCRLAINVHSSAKVMMMRQSTFLGILNQPTLSTLWSFLQEIWLHLILVLRELIWEFLLMIIKNKTRFVNLLKAVCNNNEHVCDTLSVSANNLRRKSRSWGKTDGHPIILPVSILLSSHFEAQDRILKCHFFSPMCDWGNEESLSSQPFGVYRKPDWNLENIDRENSFSHFLSESVSNGSTPSLHPRWVTPSQIFTEGGWWTRLGDPQSPTPHPQKMT